MRRLLGFLIVLGLLAGQGFSASAAICRHHSVREHEIARQSHDKHVAAGAAIEESAASVVGKKGAVSGSAGSSFALADLLPLRPPSFPRVQSQRILYPRPDARELIGISTNPPLRPPLG